MEQDTLGLPSPRGLKCDSCPLQSECLFHLPRLGGFKKPGGSAKNVAYRLITDSTENYGAKEDWIGCDVFISSGLQQRMLTGSQRREVGKDGEIIRILGTEDTEGLTVKRSFLAPINSRGQVIKPRLSMIQHLEDAGYEVNREDRSPPSEYIMVTVDLPIPKYGKRVRGVSTYQELLFERERAMAAESLAEESRDWKAHEDKVWEAAQKKNEAASGGAKRRGRPPKVTAQPETGATGFAMDDATTQA